MWNKNTKKNFLSIMLWFMRAYILINIFMNDPLLFI